MSLPTHRRSSLLRRKEPIQTTNDSSAPERATQGQLAGQTGLGGIGSGSRDNTGASADRRGSGDQDTKDSLSSPSTTKLQKTQGSSTALLDSTHSSRLPTPQAPSPRSSQFSSTFGTPLDSPSSSSFTPPRQSNPSTTTPSRNPPVSLSSSQTGSQLRTSRSNSLRRKPPPPLDFSPDDSPRSQTQIDRSDDSPKRRTSIQGKSVVPETPNREEEQRDTVSNMVDFRPSPAQSPVLNMSIPSSTLELSEDNDARDDDTIGSGISYLSSSTSSSNNLEADDQPRPYQPSSFLGSSTSSYEQAYLTRPYQGVGLGLPFSVSAAADLSSFANSGSRSSSQPHPIDIPSPSTTARDPYRSPRPEDRNGGSPVVDRGQLIGLGELATPRWTSAALERRWGQPMEDGNTDVFDVHDPMPSTRHLNESTGSPVASRQLSQSLHDPSFANRPFGNSTSSSLQPTSLLPHSTSTSSISTNVSPAGLINFGQDNASTFGNLEFTPSSPLYSLDATTPNDVLAPHAPSHSTKSRDTYSSFPAPPTPQSEESQPPRRKSVGAASSAPTSAGISGTQWGMRSGKDMVGLGFDYDGAAGGGESTSTSGTDDATSYSKRRVSQGSINSAATKRSSNRSSTDGKASLRHRRQSASKSSFAHLPPSPAAATASHNLASSTASAPVSSAPPPPPPPPQMQPTSSSQSTPSARTPDHSRLSRHSFHSHHSSPSLVAASILRHTRDLEGVDLDIEKAAAVDEGTAEALRKLDGLSSPKMSRIASNVSTTGGGGEPRSRKSSRGPIEMPSNVRRESEERVRRRTRSSLGDGGDSVGGDKTSLAGGSALPSPSLSSLPYAQPALPKSPLVGSTSSTSTGRPQPQRIPSSSNYDVPFPSSSGSPFKRGSSSSASYTVATSNSASGSHDSTSGTSFASRSVASKARRSSAGSDISSTNSGIEGRPGVERSDSNGEGDQARGIPPVPPLPKDWETYRPNTSSGPPLSASTATTASSSISFPSPRPENETRRPSFASSLENSFRSSPRAPQLEPTTSKDSGKEPSSTGRRKWSISSAFHKASKSPKTGGGIKESSSFSDLQAPSQRERKSSFGARLGDGTQLPKRMASSTNDIASLAGTRSDYSTSTTGSLGRNSIRSDKASMIARARTSSQSSTSTARTMNQQPSHPLPTPSVVTTSPGRSRSSLINPRRTPSGIPFFSRKSSNSNEPSTSNPTPSPNSEKTGEERNGRKSILGLNFLRSGGSKRDKEKSTRSPPSSSKHPTFSTSASSSTLDSDAGATDEFGRRASKTSDLLTRKRGKTLSSVDAKSEDVFRGRSQANQLPPFQMPALSSTTNRRVDALNTSQVSTASSTYSKAPPSPASSVHSTPRTRTSKLQESMRANLPTIAGSPSTHAYRQSTAAAGETRTTSQDPSPSGTPPPKSHTPTKIPRLGRIGVTASPKPLATGRSRDPSPTASSIISKSTFRRSSSFGGPGDTGNSLAATFSASVAPSALQNESTDEFGSVNREPGLQLGEKTLSTRRRLDSDATLSSGIPRSRSTTAASLASSSRDPLASSTSSSRQSTALPRAACRPSVVEEERKTAPTSSTVNSTPARSSQPRLSSLSASAPRLSSQLPSDSTSTSSSTATTLPPSSSSKRVPLKPTETNTFPRRTSLASTTSDSISSSKSTRSLASKGAIPTRVPKSSSSLTGARLSPSGTESGRSSSASPREVDEDEVRADEAMAAYVRRQYSKKLSAGMSEDTIRKMFEFPDPTDPLPPLEAKDALSLYSRFLSPYEKEEIREYRKVYFVGPNSEKKPAEKDKPTNNFGFDDERGDYLLVPHDHLHYRYEVIDVLGKGSFGQVLQCRDHKTGDMVAIKIIRNKKRFHHQALVEIKVLENLVKWDPNEKHFVIRMVDSFTFRGHLCIVTELLSINLYELVKANSFAGFSTTLIRRFTVQILGSLSLLRHHRVVHCDLKPENILLKHPAKSAIKVIDFGSSCFEHEKVYTYIQSRFYRSPEVILGMNYHMGIDMWSLGCIIAEMYTGYPIFPGENEQEQLACIMEVMGLPDKYLVDRSSRKRLFFDSTGAPRPVVNSKGRRRRPGSKTLAQVLKTDDELFIDFIAKCLIWDPDRRLKPDQAGRHAWILQNRTNTSNPPTIPPPRTSRSSALPTSTSARFNSTTNLSSISTPLKKQPQPASTSTAPLPRTRTFSTSTVNTSGSTRLGSKASLGLPPSGRYQVKS